MDNRLVVGSFNYFNYRESLKVKCNKLCEAALDYLDSHFRNSYEMFIFGSYAKHLVTENSDLDIFVVLDKNYTLKEIIKFRIDMSMYIEDMTDYLMEFDLKIITKEYFIKALSNPSSFESHINTYMFKYERR